MSAQFFAPSPRSRGRRMTQGSPSGTRASSSNERAGSNYALLIGVNENEVSAWALPNLAGDIIALEGVLTHPERCAYPPDNVKLVTGKTATRQGILDGLDWLQERVQADSSGNATAVIYYTGHGWRDDAATPAEFFLIPYDVRKDNLRSRALRATDFTEAVAALTPRRLLVALDCCHAGGMDAKELVALPAGYTASAVPAGLLMAGERNVSTAGEAKGLETLAQGRGRAVLSSSQGEQVLYMRRGGKMSIFTYHLIEALTGHAQPQEGASEVLVSDVMSYVSRHVPRSAQADWGREQTPDFQVSGNFPVALLLGGKGLRKGQPAPDPLADLAGTEPARGTSRIDTGGGAYVRGSVHINGGDFVGRNKVVHGDEVHGDKVGGDKITTGDISGTGIAIGRGAQSTVTQGLGGDELARLFATIYRQIETRPEDPDVDKEELHETVKKVQQETAKGEQANAKKVRRWLKTLGMMAPDILEVTVACLTNPVAGVADVIRKVAAKAKEQAAEGATS